MLRSSEETKKILQKECEEATFPLKPWPIESLVVKELDKNICTCQEQDEEIAAEIGKTLLNSQRLREKVAAKLHREGQRSRQPTLQQIYSSVSHQSRSRSRCTSSQPAKQPPRRNSSITRPREPVGKDANNRHTSAQRLRSSDRAPGTTKNFILANKRSVSSTKSSSDSRKPRSCSKAAPSPVKVHQSAKEDEVKALDELDRLIKKYTSAEAKVNVASLRSNCPLHAANAKRVIEEKVTTLVDAVEGLDRLGVPPRLVKVLKIYHAYLRAESDPTAIPVGRHQREAVDTFTAHFQRLDEKSRSADTAGYHALLSECATLYRQSHMDDLSSGDMRNIKYKYLHMENNAFKELGIKERAGEIKFAGSNSNELSYDFTLDVKNWLSNGVWNHSCFLGLKDVFGTYCTKYSDRRELTQFFGSIQNYQRDAYERDLSELLLKTAVPMLKESVGPESKEFTSIYKMISAICQVVNIKVPALVHVTD